MERGSGTKRLVLALLLLTLLTSAAENPPELACQNIQSLIARDDAKGALAAADEALTRFGQDPKVAGRLRILRAEALLDIDMEQARVAALPELPESLRHSESAMKRFWILGISTYNTTKDPKETRTALEAARKLAAEYQPKLLALFLLPRLSTHGVYSSGELEWAAREAIRYAQHFHQQKLEAKVHAGMALQLGLQLRYDEAINAGEKARVVAKENHYDGLLQLIEGNLGWWYYELGDYDVAEQNLLDAQAIAARLGSGGSLAAWLQLGNIAYDRGNYPAAAADYQKALALAKGNRQRGDALANLARVSLATAKYEEARGFNNDAIKAKLEAKNTEGVLRSRILDAKIDLYLKQFSQARATLETVLAEATSKAVLWRGQAALALVCIEQKEPQSAEKYFREALDTIGDSRGEIHEDERKLAFGHVSAVLYEGYVAFLVSQGRAADALRVAELSRARTLAEGLNVERDNAEEIDPERIARNAGVTVLSYWIAPDRSFLFVATAEGVKHFVLPPAKEINAKVDEYQSELASGRASIETSRRGAELYSMLVEPAAEAIRDNRIAVIPDGRLTGFNFETLVVPGRNRHYWIEDVTIETAPALQFVTAARQSGRGGRLLLIGNAPLADPEYKPLPHAAEEIANIQKYFDRHTTLAGPRATPGAYGKAVLEPYAFIHFVAHGVATRLRPLDSAIILGRDQEGYKLYARNIVGHPLKARLVTISSCHGAGRRVFTGEGLVGLAWAFLRAGAHEVVAALWQVDDASTVKLMDHMYAGIHAGRPPVDALHEAKLKLLHSRSVWRKPQYWAPFVLYSGS